MYISEENRLKVSAVQENIYPAQEKLLHSVVSDFLQSDTAFSAYKHQEHNLSLSQKREQTLLLYQKIVQRFFTSLEDFLDHPQKYLTILNAIGQYDQSLEARLVSNYLMVVRPLSLFQDYRYRSTLEQLFSGHQVGCLAMHELGHSSNLKDILTTATSHPAGYLINSTSSLGTKFYLANSDIATTCLLLCQVAGVPRMFVIPLRDAQFDLLPGLSLSDLGHKGTLNGIQHGMLQLRDYSCAPESLLPLIPLAQMLRWLEPARLNNIHRSVSTLQESLKIGSNYLMTRRQFCQSGGVQETVVYEYPLVHSLLLQQTARVLALQVALNALQDSQMDDQEQDSLAKVVKSLASLWALQGGTLIRQTTGFMGGLLVNALPQQPELDINLSEQGSNQVINQSAVKFLFACYKHLQSNQQLPYNSLRGLKIQSDDEVVQQDIPVKMPRYSAFRLYQLMQHSFNSLMHLSTGRLAEQQQVQSNIFDAWNACQQFHLQDLGRLYAYTFLFQEALALLRRLALRQSSASTVKTLDRLFQYLGLDLLLHDPVFTVAQHFSYSDRQSMRKQYLELQSQLKAFLPDLLRCLSSPQLERSPLGRPQPYQSFLERVSQSPLNVTSKPSYWQSVLPRL